MGARDLSFTLENVQAMLQAASLQMTAGRGVRVLDGLLAIPDLPQR